MTTKNLISTIAAIVMAVSAATPAGAQEASPADSTTTSVRLEDMVGQDSYHYSSAEGGFQVTWPSGCGKLRIRDNEPDYFVGEENAQRILVHLVVCDRDKMPGEGCSVKATFDVHDAEGGEAGSEQVLARVRRALETYNVKIVEQVPVRREFADDLVVEGVDVHGTMQTGEGQFWVRGLLSYHDIYILTAWSMHGELWNNPAYQEFFNGFIPYVE